MLPLPQRLVEQDGEVLLHLIVVQVIEVVLGLKLGLVLDVRGWALDGVVVSGHRAR